MSTGFEQRAAPGEQWTLVRLKDQCRRVRNGVLKRSLASAAELDDLEPANDSYNHWVHYYAQLWRIYEREKFLKHGSEYATAKLLAALDAEPIEVTLVDQSTVTVHPKSHVALGWLGDHFRALNWLGAALEVLRAKIDEGEKVGGPAFEMLDSARREHDFHLALILWSICHPGPGLPWDDDSETPEELPLEARRFYELHPIDVTRIERACQEVNATRLSVLPKPKEHGQGVSADTFFAQTAKVKGTPVRVLRRNFSLVEQVAELVLAGHTSEAL